jgi:hypothetical protein
MAYSIKYKVSELFNNDVDECSDLWEIEYDVNNNYAVINAPFGYGYDKIRTDLNFDDSNDEIITTLTDILRQYLKSWELYPG